MDSDSTKLAVRGPKLPWLVALTIIIAATLLVAIRNRAERAGASSAEQLGSPSAWIIEGLSIEPKTLDVGEIWETKEYVHRLSVRNETGSPIKFSLIASCNCTSISPRVLTIPASQSEQIELKIDLTHRLPGEMGWARRDFGLQLTPVFEERHISRHGWILHGVIKSRITLNEDFLQFGESQIYGQRPPTRRLVAKVHVPTERLEIRTDEKVVVVQMHRISQNEFELDVSPSANLSPGQFRTDLSIDLVTPSHERLDGIILPVAGTVQPEVRLLSACVFLGSHRIGASANAIVVLQTPPGVAAVVDRVESDSEALAAAPTKVDGLNSGRAFLISQKITNRGEHSGNLRFLVRRDSEQLSVSVKVVYRGEPRDWIGASSRESRHE